MACSNCGGNHDTRANPLDCNQNFLSCSNPCGTGPSNTAACESLPSQIENFTLQFFGTIVKTEVNGVVTWSLPCSLGVGLPNNPRGVDEGLACYFLRLFHDGIVGLTGPAGPAGANGTNGNNAYTVTLHSFTQPTLSAPVVQVVTQFNPAIRNGTYVFIDTSGWYLVNENDGNGVLLLTLVKTLGNSGTITAGKLVVPSGFPGASIQGPPGPQGPKGDQGAPGSSVTTTNGFYFANVGTDYPVPLTYAPVDFVNSQPQVLLPAAGKYKISANVTADVVGNLGSAAIAKFKLYNLTNASDVAGSERIVRGANVIHQSKFVSIDVIVQTDGPSQTVSLFAEANNLLFVNVLALNTTITFVRIA